jgi:hypothetical protein
MVCKPRIFYFPNFPRKRQVMDGDRIAGWILYRWHVALPSGAVKPCATFKGCLKFLERLNVRA